MLATRTVQTLPNLSEKTVCTLLDAVAGIITEKADGYQKLFSTDRSALSLANQLHRGTILSESFLPYEQQRFQLIVQCLASDPDLKKLAGQRVKKTELATLLHEKITALFFKGGPLYDSSIESLRGEKEIDVLYFPKTHADLLMIRRERLPTGSTWMFHWTQVLDYTPWFVCHMAHRRLAALARPVLLAVPQSQPVVMPEQKTTQSVSQPSHTPVPPSSSAAAVVPELPPSVATVINTNHFAKPPLSASSSLHRGYRPSSRVPPSSKSAGRARPNLFQQGLNQMTAIAEEVGATVADKVRRYF